MFKSLLEAHNDAQSKRKDDAGARPVARAGRAVASSSPTARDRPPPTRNATTRTPRGLTRCLLPPRVLVRRRVATRGVSRARRDERRARGRGQRRRPRRVRSAEEDRGAIARAQGEERPVRVRDGGGAHYTPASLSAHPTVSIPTRRDAFRRLSTDASRRRPAWTRFLNNFDDALRGIGDFERWVKEVEFDLNNLTGVMKYVEEGAEEERGGADAGDEDGNE
eukprot:31095-Pelagococcus_subviridis.AAC.4